MDVVLSKSRLRPLLFVPLGLVVLAGVLVEVLRPVYGLPSRSGFVPFFSMSYEGNVPTFYTSALLGFTSLLLMIAAAAARRAGERFAAHWWVLAAGFAYIAVDEVFQFHEMAGTFFQLSGVLYFSWVIPAAIVVLVVGLSYVPFLRHLPRRTSLRFLVAGAIYVGGAVGMELPLGYWTEQHGSHNLGYGLIDAVEESLEMLGINLFLLWLVDHLAEKGVTLRFAAAPEAPAEPAAEAADAP
ncbi:hypothetical protein [Polyangium spumosum]|uniref:DUF998 domain-containing protein n=1 Tax=Polyangium spumosum TaxID=889282 RepID=A0A6N7Q0N6_9BACT|nr:hypothetical protein [Polyangium spumosum]MRG97908.1 hypothetical protein [Polyangium spumosum]